jgi:hypothetical protein
MQIALKLDIDLPIIKNNFRLFAKVLVISVAMLFQTIATFATARAEGVEVSIAVPGAWLRVGPDMAASNNVPIFMDERYSVIERTADTQWLKLAGGKIGQNEAWVHVSLVFLKTGVLSDAPITRSQFVGAPSSSVPPMATYIPKLSAKMQQLLAHSGRNPSAFTVIGDCNAEPQAYLGRVTAGLYQPPANHSYLLATLSRFSQSFAHYSIAAKGGFRASSMLDVSWADPAECKAGEGPLTCELRRSNAGFVFIELGTGDQFAWREFEKHYRAIIETILRYRAVPVAVTKADNLEQQAGSEPMAINSIIRKLAIEYDIPLLDFWQSVQGLPNGGLIDEGNADFHLSPAGSDQHLLVTLQTLTAFAQGSTAHVSQPLVVASATPQPTSNQTESVGASTSSGQTQFRVTVPVANIRNNPSLSAQIIGRAFAGQSFVWLGASNDRTWVRVVLQNSLSHAEGWIFGALGQTISATPTPTPIMPISNNAGSNNAGAKPSQPGPIMPQPGTDFPVPVNPNPIITINVSAVNIRSGPGTQFFVRNVARQGQVFPVVGRIADNTWVEIAFPGAGPSWVFTSLGTISGNLQLAPVR